MRATKKKTLSRNVAVATPTGDVAGALNSTTATEGLTAPTFKELAITAIRLEPELQARASLDQAVINLYALSIRSLPRIVVFFDGKDHLLADGHLRLAAHRKARKTKVQAEVRQGTKRDAELFALGANGKHGLRLTTEEKRTAVRKLLADSEWAKRSNGWIARHVGVSKPFVAELREEGGATPDERIGQDGRLVRTAAIGKRSRTPGLQEDTAMGSPDTLIPPGAAADDCKRLQSEPGSEASEMVRGPSTDIASALINLVGNTDPGLAPRVAELQSFMLAVVGGVGELRTFFHDVVERAVAIGPSVLAVQGSGIEHQFNELERALLTVTPDRPCSMCPDGEQPCFCCLGGRWIGRPANFNATNTAELKA